MSDFVRTTRTKRVSSHTTKRTILRFFIVALSFIISFALALFCVSLLLLRFSTWKIDRPLSVVFLSGDNQQVRKSVTLVWVDPSQHDVKVLQYPDEVRVKTESGLYPLSALYGLYAIDKKSVEHFLLTLSSNLHIATDGIILVPEAQTMTQETIKKTLRNAFFSNKQESSLSRPDLFALWWFFSFHSHNTALLQIPQSAIEKVQEKNALLFTKSYDAFVMSTFVDKRIQSEGLTVAVMNATGRQKMASNMSKLLNVFGIQVFSVGDIAGEPKSKIVVGSDEIARSRTAQLCARLSAIPIEVDTKTTQDYRTDIVMFLGEDQANSVIQ